MERNVNTVIDDISKDIFKCRECDFFKEINEESSPFCPDVTYHSYEFSPKAFVIGINPSFNDDEYIRSWKSELYSANDYLKFKSNLQKYVFPIIGYQRGVSDVFKKINNELNLYPELKGVDDGLFVQNIYKYVFWANLSFCSSQNPYSRIIDRKEISCRVFEEEIPNCLEKHFLARYIAKLQPEFIMLFTIGAKGYFYWKHILKKLFADIAEWKITEQMVKKYEAHKRKGVSVDIEIVAAKVNAYGKRVNILFFPHPNYQFTNENKDKVINDVGTWFREDHIIN